MMLIDVTKRACRGGDEYMLIDVNAENKGIEDTTGYDQHRRGINMITALSLHMKFIISKENTNTKLSRPLPKTDMLNLDF